MLDPVVDKGQLTETDRFIFESWGYFMIPNVLTKDEAAEAYDVSRRLHQNRDREFGQIGRTYESEPVLERLIDHPDVLPKVQGLLGDRFVLQAGWNTMQPAHAGNGGWHQDGSSAFDFKDLGFPVPLLQLRVSYLLTDQTVPGMGNMELIPGSHRSRVGLPDSIRKSKGDIAIGHVVCAEAGAALVFHNGVWHRTFRHDGDRDRFTTHYVYSPPWVRPADRLSNDPEFLERTTPLRRALMGEFARPDAPFGANYDPLPI